MYLDIFEKFARLILKDYFKKILFDFFLLRVLFL